MICERSVFHENFNIEIWTYFVKSTIGCVILRTFFQIMLLISPVDLLYAPNFHTKFQSNPIIFKPPPSTVYIYTCFQWAKRIILAVWPHRPNYASINFLKFLIMFADHENIGKELKFTVLLYSDQDLWGY